MKKKTHEDFAADIAQKLPTLKLIGKYVNNRTRIAVECMVCGDIFNPIASSLYIGCGCPRCNGSKKRTHNEFIQELNVKMPNIEVLSTYTTNKDRVSLRCKVCNHTWNAIASSPLRGKGCAKCAGTLRKTHAQFIDQMQERHPDIEVLGNYINNREKVRCKCLRCNGIFMGIPHSMIDSWHGCPHCASSVGERAIHIWLTRNNISHFVEYTFKDCKDIKPLPFDFYLPDYNMVIEYDGRQHFEPNNYFGGVASFENLKQHDEMKNVFCMQNNISLLRIPYWDFDNINTILAKALAI